MAQTNNKKVLVGFWGTRGSISTPGGSTEKYGGNTPCVSYYFNGTDIILDAGTGIRNLGIELMRKSKRRNHQQPMDLHLFLSHTHWDHIQGLPFFPPAYMKNTKLRIYGSPNKESFLAAILQGQMDINYFPVEMKALAADLSITEMSEKKIVIGDVVIDWQEQVLHPGGSVRYRLKANDKTVVYATDIELDAIFSRKSDTGRSRKLAHEYREFIHGADLLIADAQYTAREYPQKTGWGHTAIPTVIEIAHQEKVRQLALFHHEPLHTDSMLDKLWSKYGPLYEAKKTPMTVFWAREGMTLAI